MNKYQKSIRSVEDIYNAMCFTKEIVKESFSQKWILKLQLVVEEACTNAYEYCLNKGLEDIKITWQNNKTSLEIIVEHPGNEFPLCTRSHPHTDLRGRGLMLITHLMDDVLVQSKKQKVQLYMRKDK